MTAFNPLQTQDTNDVDSLRQGYLHIPLHKQELVILIIGETGVGKTTLFSFIAHVLAGRSLEQYQDAHDKSQEAGGSQSGSQTNGTTVYSFKSKNGTSLRIVDTPGLADTRGIEFDEQHKQSIAETIHQQVETVDAVLILANGTVPRLGVATDYALTTLSSIFPRTLSDNIGIVFTNVDDQFSINFEQDSLPLAIRNARQFFINNPIAMYRKYLQALEEGNDMDPTQLKRCLTKTKQSEVFALETLADLFTWINDLVPQPTAEIYELYQKSRSIDKNILDAIACMDQAAEKKQEIEKAVTEIQKAESLMKISETFTKIATKQIYKQETTSEENTICAMPGCYSNCHESCGCWHGWWFIPSFCSAMLNEAGWGGWVCNKCNHSRDDHWRRNTRWELSPESETIVDHSTKATFDNAHSTKEQQELLLAATASIIAELTNTIDESITSIGILADEYSQLSLSGNFSGQVERSVSLLEKNIEKMRGNGSDRASIQKLERGMTGLTTKLDFLKRENRDRTRGKIDTLRSLARPWLPKMLGGSSN